VDTGTPRTAHAYAYDTLRNLILSGELAPGAPLVQTALAERLSISMTPIREALRDLATEGLVTQSAHKKAAVASLDVREAIEVAEIRLKLEPDAAAEAALVMPAQRLNEAEALATQLDQLAGAEWVAANRRFHTMLLADTPSHRMRALLNSLIESAALYVGFAMQYRRGEAPDVEHREIIEAYRARDAARVADAVRTHLESSLRSLREFAEHTSAGDES